MSNIKLLPIGFIVTYVFIIGLCIGSFLNVAILRGLKGEDVVLKRSHCPNCKNNLKWYMNIPLLSYIFLRGKCAFCDEKISFQYPLVEFVTALSFVASYFAFGLTLKLLFAWVILSLFIVMSATDFKETVIIDIHAYILLGVGLLYSFLNLGEINIIQGLIGAAFGFLLFEIFARIGQLLCGCRMFGEGDSLIALGIGAMFGYKVMLLIFLMSIVIQTLCAIPIMIINSIKQNKNRLAVSYLFVFVSLVLVGVNNYFKLFQEGLSFLGFIIFILSGCIWSLKNIIAEIKAKKDDETKQGEEKFSLMPFGPALLIASTLCLFYISQIKNLLAIFIN